MHVESFKWQFRQIFNEERVTVRLMEAWNVFWLISYENMILYFLEHYKGHPRACCVYL